MVGGEAGGAHKTGTRAARKFYQFYTPLCATAHASKMGVLRAPSRHASRQKGTGTRARANRLSKAIRYMCACT